ncbi:MAG: hypothetical protein DDT31_01070 [Syntrophomonadaceae bacterium]|nr:hypothetical protein [Bacillota bacterium]
MIELQYSLVIEATEEPDLFGFYSPDREGSTGIGHSIEACLYKSEWGMIESEKVNGLAPNWRGENGDCNYQ